MKIKELIEKLQELYIQYGNLTVYGLVDAGDRNVWHKDIYPCYFAEENLEEEGISEKEIIIL